MNEYKNNTFLQCSHYFLQSNIDLKEEEHNEHNENLVLITIDILEKKFNYLDTQVFINLFEFLDAPFFQEGVVYNVEFNYTMNGRFIPMPQRFIGTYIRQIYEIDGVVFIDENGNERYVKVRDGNYFIPIYT
jgi:hypothetical protein